jgi:DNA-binding response OmpR family regulator
MAKILSIGYDEPLLLTRQYILQQAGFTVVSALRLEEAIRHCKHQKFDLIVLGHSIPPTDKTRLIAAGKKLAGCPTLSITGSDQSPHPGVDYSVDASEGPRALVHAIQAVLGGISAL